LEEFRAYQTAFNLIFGSQEYHLVIHYISVNQCAARLSDLNCKLHLLVKTSPTFIGHVHQIYQAYLPNRIFTVYPASVLAFLISVTLLAGCDLFRTDADEQEPIDRSLERAAGIIWTLDLWDVEGLEPHQQNFPDFHLVFENNSKFRGDDGCNSYFGEFTVENDFISPTSLSATLMACDFATFPYNHLQQTFYPEFGHDELTITAEGEIYHYRSDHAEAVSGTPMVENIWQLNGSTDREIDSFEGNMVPELALNADRTFSIDWYWDADDSVFDSYQIKGYWGIAEDGAFRLYRTGSRGGSAGQSHVMRRLTNVSAYRMDEPELVLIDNNSGVEHRFRPSQGK